MYIIINSYFVKKRLRQKEVIELKQSLITVLSPNTKKGCKLEETAHLLLLFHKDLKVLIDDGDSQQDTSSTTNGTCT